MAELGAALLKIISSNVKNPSPWVAWYQVGWNSGFFGWLALFWIGMIGKHGGGVVWGVGWWVCRLPMQCAVSHAAPHASPMPFPMASPIWPGALLGNLGSLQPCSRPGCGCFPLQLGALCPALAPGSSGGGGLAGQALPLLMLLLLSNHSGPGISVTSASYTTPHGPVA